ncbi:hypothetical protein WJX73_009419 [Symbiochloris irregularis]|uniref:Uncharacterized protein n=1 Tax=Symbiochloris irregularis TaxID=706552 RepID=A0AAW1P260_9CHLO
MFPWERRQIEGAGTPLRTWEKAYWGIFVTAIALFLFSRLHSPPPAAPEIDTQAAQDKEEKKRQAARAVLAGKSFTEAGDVFEGLTPQEIQEYVAEATNGATSQDPFEGLSPEEINEYLATGRG